MASMVVMEAHLSGHRRTLWAWCKVGDEPGFEEITYTEADGVTPVDGESELDEPPALGRHVFTVPMGPTPMMVVPHKGQRE